MRKLLTLLLVFFSATGLAQDRAVTFSRYCAMLKLVSYDKTTATTRFRGTIALEGMLFFEFDEADQGRMDGVIWAKFVPAASFVHLLPAVVAGDHPAPVKYLELPGDEALDATFGKEEATRLSHGTRHLVSTPVRLVIHDYLSDVECDSRSYFVKQYSVARLSPQEVASAIGHDASGGEPPHGC